MLILLIILIICIAIAFKIYYDKSNLQKTVGNLLEKILYNQRWIYLDMDEVQLLPGKILAKTNLLVRYMGSDPNTFWTLFPKAKVLIIMDDDKKEPIGLLKTIKTNTSEQIFQRVNKKGSFVDDFRESVYISSVFIHPNYRSMGYGEKLLNLSLKLIKIDYDRFIKIHKMLKVILEVKKINKAAYKLYEKIGFKNVGKNDEEYLMMFELVNQLNQG